MEKTAILFSVLLLGWTWTLQGVTDAADDDDQAKTTEGATVNTAEDNTAVHDATGHNTTLHNATDAALIRAPFSATEICAKAPVTGPCKAFIERYFYNSTSKSCEKFVYGGCGGNRNNFKNEKACMQRCHPKGMALLGAEEGEEGEEGEEVEEGEEEVCNKVPETGPCKAYQDRYFYNSTSMSCEKFVYGGCGGNQNNFKDDKECLQRCVPEEEEHPTAA